jgi:hypothetical protein
MPGGRLWLVRDAYAAQTAWAPRHAGKQLRLSRLGAFDAALGALRADAEANAARKAGDHDCAGRHETLAASYRALRDHYQRRERALAQAMAGREEWDHATASARHLAIAAAAGRGNGCSMRCGPRCPIRGAGSRSAPTASTSGPASTHAACVISLSGRTPHLSRPGSSCATGAPTAGMSPAARHRSMISCSGRYAPGWRNPTSRTRRRLTARRLHGDCTLAARQLARSSGFVSGAGQQRGEMSPRLGGQ